jgi:hypothetical protein
MGHYVLRQNILDIYLHPLANISMGVLLRFLGKHHIIVQSSAQETIVIFATHMKVCVKEVMEKYGARPF